MEYDNKIIAEAYIDDFDNDIIDNIEDDDISNIEEIVPEYNVHLSEKEIDDMCKASLVYSPVDKELSVIIRTDLLMREYDDILSIVEMSSLPNLHILAALHSTYDKMNVKSNKYIDFLDFIERLHNYNESIPADQKNLIHKYIHYKSITLGFDYINIKDERTCIKYLKEILRVFWVLNKHIPGLISAGDRDGYARVVSDLDISTRKMPRKNSCKFSDALEILNNYCSQMNAVTLCDLCKSVFKLSFEPDPEEFKKLINKDNVAGTIQKTLASYGLNFKNLWKFKYNIVNRKTTEVIVPENTYLSFGNFNLDNLKDDLKSSIFVNVDGSLVINNLYEFHNLKYLNEDYRHNNLTIKCELTPKMLKAILVKASFDNIDLTAAELTDDMIVNMNNVLIKNHDCQITGNSKIKIVRN